MSKVTVYSAPARIIHWAMALLLWSLLFAGLSMVQSLQTWQVELMAIHKSFGVLALLLVIARLTIRLTHEKPDLPAELPHAQKKIAHISHVLLYAAMFAMPLSGYLMQNAAGRPIEVFGLFTLPALIPVNLSAYSFFREMHAWVAWGLIALVLLHIAAALHHGLIRKDSVLKSMLGKRSY
ncbi:MAG: cytochrome b561 CybB [Idiomarinaceae bacterium HL-53]|nr:MAG: cytochrome b561 CybB [Idiomarinaceae bacterium HL-53]CUS48021.1 cytochrome b561 [Idiomarinaceae bacterium HL-53]